MLTSRLTDEIRRLCILGRPCGTPPEYASWGSSMGCVSGHGEVSHVRHVLFCGYRNLSLPVQQVGNFSLTACHERHSRPSVLARTRELAMRTSVRVDFFITRLIQRYSATTHDRLSPKLRDLRCCPPTQCNRKPFKGKTRVAFPFLDGNRHR
jgi:hypothetical protein